MPAAGLRTPLLSDRPFPLAAVETPTRRLSCIEHDFPFAEAYGTGRFRNVSHDFPLHRDQKLPTFDCG